MALQVQEPTLRAFFQKTGVLARGSGFLARFLIAWPESTQGFRSFSDAPENWPALEAFNRCIATILDQQVPITAEGILTPHMLSLAPDAKAAWVRYHDDVERSLAAGGALFDVRDVASKSADNAARLAALFHIFERGHADAIGLDAFNGASRVAAWHLNESRRFFGELALPVELVNAVRLDAWLLAYCKRERSSFVPAQKVQQFGPSVIREKASLEAAARVLEELHRARMARDGRARVVEINPTLAASAIL
jgi:putative DNA primase/helicase